MSFKFARAPTKLPGGGRSGAAHLEAAEPAQPAYKKTKFGKSFILVPLAYQQPFLPFGFQTMKIVP